MTKICAQCTARFEITEGDKEFYQKAAPVFNGEQFDIPEPDLCPECRKKRRLSWRNLRYVYYRTCDFTGEKIMSCYDKDSPLKVYRSDIWWSDKWDPLEYGRDFDSNRPFFEQWYDLIRAVPVLDRYALMNENCDFINGAANCKNCYLSFNMDYCDSCFYVSEAKHSVSCMDCNTISHCELCYECVETERCYNLKCSERCQGCSDSWFLMDCRQCKNCIGCVNLVGKENYIFNKKATPQEVARYKEAFKSRAYINEFAQKFQEFSLQYPRKYYYGHSNENFSGNIVQNSKNSFECYDASEVENCSYCYYVFKANNCRDYDIFGDHSEWIYNCMAMGVNCSYNICCMGVWRGSSNNMYCHLMSGSSNNFACSGLKQKQYCILNKQYTKEEYEALVPKILSHMKNEGTWGQFPPQQYAHYGYNETYSNSLFPMTKEEALAQGYRWKDAIFAGPSIPSNAVGADTLSDRLDGMNENDIKEKAFVCIESGKPFKIIPQEFKLYQSHGLPLPVYNHEVRHLHRRTKQNPHHVWDRNCAKCATGIKTSYDPERPEIVYCEKCYLEAVE